jgi:hypothetical protein
MTACLELSTLSACRASDECTVPYHFRLVLPLWLPTYTYVCSSGPRSSSDSILSFPFSALYNHQPAPLSSPRLPFAFLTLGHNHQGSQTSSCVAHAESPAPHGLLTLSPSARSCSSPDVAMAAAATPDGEHVYATVRQQQPQTPSCRNSAPSA